MLFGTSRFDYELNFLNSQNLHILFRAGCQGMKMPGFILVPVIFAGAIPLWLPSFGQAQGPAPTATPSTLEPIPNVQCAFFFYQHACLECLKWYPSMANP
jgi:hypothetical protein